MMGVDNARMGVERTIAHCIAHNLILDKTFNVDWYIAECRVVLEDALIPDYLISEILDEGETQGKLESVMPIGDSISDNGGAAISPAYNPILLGNIMKLQNSLGGN